MKQTDPEDSSDVGGRGEVKGEGQVATITDFLSLSYSQ